MAIITKMGGCSTKRKKIGLQFLDQGDKFILGGSYTISGDSMVESEASLGSKIEIGQSYSGAGCTLCKNKYAFRCGSCGRIICYDGSAQKNVKCPVCGSVGDVPKAKGVEVPVSSSTGKVSEVIEETPQGVIVQITFSNVTWTQFDNVKKHDHDSSFKDIEPKVHVVYDKEKIEFHGYNVSNMDEGVYYTIGANDDFSIECDVNTSTIKPHPGGYLYIQLGIITAKIDLNGGNFYMDGKQAASVGTKFRMRLARTKGIYEIYIDGNKKSEKAVNSSGETKIVFGFVHDSHFCSSLSHAYISDIKMTQCAW